jgi:hypothetical protein
MERAHGKLDVATQGTHTNTMEALNDTVYTYDDICRDDIEWVERELLYGWGEKRWTIPMLPILEPRTLKIRRKYPHLTNKQLNLIIKDVNNVLRAIKAEERRSKRA